MKRSLGILLTRAKVVIIVGDKLPASRSQVIAHITGFSRKSLPTKYLGCMLFSGRKKISYFGDMVAKIEKKLAGWKGKLLTTGGRLALIKHVLQSVSIHILTAFDRPKAVFQRLESFFLISFGVILHLVS